MRALLLAGGLGTRLRPLTDRLPKCLVPIHGVPLLDYWLNLLLPGGIDQVLINTHYLAEQVADHVAASRWRHRITLCHEASLLGTAGTILHNRQFFGEGALMVAHADNLTSFDVAAFMQAHAHRPEGIEATMMTFRTDHPQSCGIVELDADQIVTAMHEKQPNPPGNLANGAIYIFEPTIFATIARMDSAMPDISLDLLPTLMGAMQAYHNDIYLRDIGNMASLRLAEQEFPLLSSKRVGT